MSQYSTSIQKVALAALYKSFGWLSLAIGVTSVVSFFASQSWELIYYLSNNMWVLLCLIGLQMGTIIAMTYFYRSLSYSAMVFGLLCASFLFGISLSYIFLMYELSSIIYVLFLTAGIFGMMSIYGITTKHNLNAMGMFASAALFGVILLGFINIFFKSAQFNLFLSFISVIIFSALIAYDAQKMLYVLSEMAYNQQEQNKMAVYAALAFYLDFINLFVNLLKLLGKKKDN